MLLCLRNQGAVIDDRAVGDGVRSVVYGDSCGYEIAVGVLVAGADFRELAGAATYRVLMAVYTGSGVEDGAESGAGIVLLLEAGLVQGIGIAGELCDTVADALGSRVLRERGCVKPSGGFGCKK